MNFLSKKKIRDRILFVLECLNAILLLSPLGVALYSCSEGHVEQIAAAMFLISLGLITVLTVWMRLLGKKTKGLFLYFLGSAAACVFLYFNYLYLHQRYEGVVFAAFTVSSVALGLAVLFFETLLIRLDENEEKRAKLEHDVSYQEPDRLLRKPLSGLVFYFAFLYFVGLLRRGKVLCTVSLWLLVAYILLLILYQYVKGTELFLSNRHGVTNVPEKRIWRVGSILVITALFAVLLAGIIAATGSGNRHYFYFKMTRPEVTKEEEMKPFGELFTEHSERMSENELMMLTEDAEPWAGWNVIFWTLGIASIGFAALGLFKAVQRLFANFRRFSEEEENGDEVISLDPEDDTVRAGGVENRLKTYFTEREKIRRRYKRTIKRKAVSDIDLYLTPDEIEKSVGLSEDPGMKDLHDLYENARYGA